MEKFKMPLIVAGGLLLAALLYIFVIRAVSVYEAIPASAVAVIETSNWQKLSDKLNSTTSGNGLKGTYAMQKLQTELQLMQQLMGSDKALKDAVTSVNTVASLHLISANDFDYLFTTELSGINDNTILNRIQSSPKVKTVSVHVFKNQKIVDVTLRDGGQLSFAKRKNILAFSYTSFLTENAITAIQTGDNLDGEKSFKPERNASADVQVYFNTEKADVIFPVGVKSGKLGLLTDVKKQGKWGRFDINLGNDKLELDGDIWADNKDMPEGKNILEGNLFAKIPDHAAYAHVSRADTAGSEMLNQYFGGWMGDAKAFVILEPLNENFSEQNVFILQARNATRALADLKSLMGANGAAQLPVDTFGSYMIYNLEEGTVINQVFGNSLVTFTNTYFVVYSNTVIFANNADVLKLWLEKVDKGETLDKDKNFTATGYTQFGQNSSIQYVNIQRSDLLLSGVLKENSTISPFITSYKNALIVSNTTEDKVSVHAVFNTGGEGKTQAGLLWKTQLKSTATYTPQVLTNSSTGEQEIFVQDTANNIYLLNQSGEVLFSKNIGEPVLGKVYQVDYYSNGKQQYIFNSAQHVFIVDRLGYDVAAYPLRLSATAAAGLSIANKRYYVPCTNGSIYGYEANGKPLSGWSPRSGVGAISQQLQCFAVGRNDYVLAFNTAGRLMLFDTKGGMKWSVDDLPISNQGFSVVKVGDDVKLLNAAGKQLIEIGLDGNDNIRPLIDSADAFCAIAVADTEYTYFYSTGSQIRGYTNGYKFVGAANIAGATLSSIEIVQWNNQPYLVLYDNAAHV
ncbi:MAG TPA: hypothetical protein VK174_06570, partial [Chitinophagales bacterium]|nr:hypothetical protein [Chitinophagales bacterium]